jgi:hypothetical protein
MTWGDAARLSGLLVLVVTLGCEADPVAPANDPLVTDLINLGFHPGMIEDRGEYFLVEGDIEVAKKDVPELAKRPPVRTLELLEERPEGIEPRFQWRTNVIVGQTQVKNIKVSLGGLASVPSWQTAARNAMTQWNNVSCAGVRLTEGTPANIAFSIYTDAPNVAALGSFPTSSGNPGPTIKVNTAYTGSPNNTSTKLRNMVHEIGHTLGYRHTNWQNLGETPSSANLVPGTPSTDGASVMNGATATTSWSGFSFYDQVATKTLYPGLCPNLAGPSQVWPYHTCSWTVSATGGTPPYKYSWFEGPLGNATTYLLHNSGSGFTIRAAVVDATGRRVTQSMGVSVYQFGPACG